MSLTPRLSEYARSFVYPVGITRTVWPRVERKGAELGLGFDWWQQQLGAVCLGYRDDGRYAATIGGIGLSIPRQVGKTYFVMSMLFIMCVLFPGLQVVWTSHHLRTTNRTLSAMQGIAARPKVDPHVRNVRTSHGEGQVEFVNGSVIMFGARSQGFGRGFEEIDVEVFDEAQILDTRALEDMIAATNQARHAYGALLFYMGTPPRPIDPSEAFRERRDEALAGEAEDSVWLEISADPDSDVNDEDQWSVMNPSYPLRTPREALLRLRKQLKDDDSWNREGRGIWDPKNTNQVIDPASWARVADPASMPVERLALGVDVSPDRSKASVVLAGERFDGLLHVELDEYADGTEWVVPWVANLCAKNEIRAVVVEKLSPAASLLEDFDRAKVKVTEASTADAANACGQLYDAVMGKVDDDGVSAARLRHRNQPQVNAALAMAGKRDLGGGRWTWNRASAEITPIVAASLALWGSQTKTVKRPGSGARRTSGRKAVVL